jgi:Ca-activated chloride channel family protein
MPKQAVFALAAALGCFAGDIVTEMPGLNDDRIGGLLLLLFLTALWSIFLCFGISFAIVAAQNKLLHKPLMRGEQLKIVIKAAVIGGGIAGLVAQFLFSLSGTLIDQSYEMSYDTSYLQFHNVVVRALCWGLMGALSSRSMSRHIANFNKKWAFWGGFAGGVFACIVFLTISGYIGELAGRLFGAFLLGLCVGSMVGIVETVFRDAWLNVIYAPNEITRVNLGANAVTFGTGETDTVFVRGASVAALGFKLQNGTVFCTENRQTRAVSIGEKIPLARITIEVCSQKGAGNTTLAHNSSYPSRHTEKPLFLYVKTYSIPLTGGQKLYACHTVADSADGRTVTGEITTKKSDTSQIGIRNLSDDVWIFNMQSKKVRLEKGKVIPLMGLNKEITVNFKNVIGSIAAGSFSSGGMSKK